MEAADRKLGRAQHTSAHEIASPHLEHRRVADAEDRHAGAEARLAGNDESGRHDSRSGRREQRRARDQDELSDDDQPAQAEALGQPPGPERGDEAGDAGGRESQADHRRAEMQRTGEVEEVDRGLELREEDEHGVGRGYRTQDASRQSNGKSLRVEARNADQPPVGARERTASRARMRTMQEADTT
jgi:hypothetical protein